MPTRSLWNQAVEKAVPLERIVEVLKAAAEKHFGPEVVIEVNLDAEKQAVELFAVSRVKLDATAPATVALAAVKEKFGDVFAIDDEIMTQVFFTPDDETKAETQDQEYEALIGVSGGGSGFWPVARAAVAPLLGLTEDPLEDIVQRALLFAVATAEERGPNFVLRRDGRGGLVIKERVVVGRSEIAARYSGRRDLLEGVTVEVARREVQVGEVIAALFAGQAVSEACDGTAFTTSQVIAALEARDVHLGRRTAFRGSVERLRPAQLEQFALLVSSEREGRFVRAAAP